MAKKERDVGRDRGKSGGKVSGQKIGMVQRRTVSGIGKKVTYNLSRGGKGTVGKKGKRKKSKTSSGYGISY